MSRSFKLGDLVKWESQAQGSWTKKIGTVIEVVLVGEQPSMSPWLYARPRKEESYLVEVASNSKHGRPKIYWPMSRNLSPVSRGAARKAG